MTKRARSHFALGLGLNPFNSKSFNFLFAVENNNHDFTLEEGVVNKSYILAQGKQLANPTPKYQAILPDINCFYLN